MMNNDAFDSLWKKFFYNEDVDSMINDHQREREPLIRSLRDAVEAKLASQATVRPLRVLEIGCGTAVDSYLVAAFFPTSDVAVHASDLSIDALRVATELRTRFPQPLHFSAGNVFHLPFPDDKFDIVFSQGVVEHFDDPVASLAEQKRVLKSDGCLIVDVPQKYHLYTLYKRRKVRSGTWRFGWETQYSFGELRRMGRQIGLRAVDRFGYGDGLRIGNRYPLLRRLVDYYNTATLAASRRLGASHLLLLNLVIIFHKA